MLPPNKSINTEYLRKYPKAISLMRQLGYTVDADILGEIQSRYIYKSVLPYRWRARAKKVSRGIKRKFKRLATLMK